MGRALSAIDPGGCRVRPASRSDPGVVTTGPGMTGGVRHADRHPALLASSWAVMTSLSRSIPKSLVAHSPRVPTPAKTASV